MHISDLSWTEHIEHPADSYKKGEEVEAIIIGINKQNKKISLGIKQLLKIHGKILKNNIQLVQLLKVKFLKLLILVLLLNYQVASKA